VRSIYSYAYGFACSFICLFIHLGAIYNIFDLDYKKQSDSKKTAFEFHTKKISVYEVDDNIIKEIHKFPFPFQHLIVKEACAVMDRIEKGKSALSLISLDCFCLFHN